MTTGTITISPPPDDELPPPTWNDSSMSLSDDEDEESSSSFSFFFSFGSKCVKMVYIVSRTCVASKVEITKYGILSLQKSSKSCL